MKYEKINYSIVGRFGNGIAYGIITRRTVSGYIPEGMEGFAIRKDGKTWHIDHIASGLSAGNSGYKTRELAVKDFKENIEKRINGISAKTIAEMIERHDAAPFDDEVASWQTVNYTSTYEHRIDKIMEAARRAGLICRNNGKSGELNGVTIFGSMEKMQTINKMIAEYEKRDAERAAEDAAPIAKTENVAVLPESKNEERPETISNDETPAQEAEQKEEKNVYTWPELKTMENRFDIKKTMQDDVKTLETIYGNNVGMYSARPDETIREYVQAVGYGRACSAVASLVNRSAWDGRIDKRNAAWAASVAGSLDEECCQHFSIYTNRIHMAHLNQLADALRNFTPDDHSETTDETPAQDAETPAERPETISEEAEAAQADPEEMDTTDEEAPQAVGNKPARGPVKPKDFAGESLSGRGWSIVFDSGLQRTRVIVKSEIRETVAPIIQDAGFYWSENMGSYNKKLTHKAHRAALALAEKLNSATA